MSPKYQKYSPAHKKIQNHQAVTFEKLMSHNNNGRKILHQTNLASFNDDRSHLEVRLFLLSFSLILVTIMS
jgi:hypothetical protein